MYGKTRDEHDSNLEKCLQRLSTKGLRLNQSKCTFLSNTLSFFGQIAYASRALTDVEKRYSQTEKEALAIIWGVEQFHLYLYGNDFTLITDHKPLEVIYGSRKSKPSARLERWVLRLQPYSFNVVYKPGANNPADYLSRHPPQTSLKQQKLTEEYVNFLTQNSIPKAMTLEEIQAATDSDKTLKGLRAAIKLNKWDYE